VVEHALDLLEREARRAQRQDPVQATDVAVAVEPVAGAGALGRDEQPDLVVVVQVRTVRPVPLATAPIRDCDVCRGSLTCMEGDGRA
jgi:hypothetical protein